MPPAGLARLDDLASGPARLDESARSIGEPRRVALSALIDLRLDGACEGIACLIDRHAASGKTKFDAIAKGIPILNGVEKHLTERAPYG